MDWMNGELLLKIGKISPKIIAFKFVALNKIPNL